ncbi:MAG: GDP-mannose 4,6-dehydratase [Hadesarchaea archaeon]|nr:GDP-mannose 4,6-dehydratase [Hadesarchaea archaeon]
MGWSGKNVLITGITGFVGSCLARRLVKLGAEVTGITRGEKYANNLSDLNVNLVQGNILDYPLIERVLAEYETDVCFHLAAQTIVRRSIKNPTTAYQTNVMGTVNMLEACRHVGIEGFLYTSTDKVYGEPDQLPIPESAPLNASGVYESSKAAADRIARAYATMFDLPAVVSRACNIYGPGDTNPRIIPNTIKMCLCKEPPIIYAGINGIREYIYVEDCVDAYLLLAENIEKTRGDVFNVGSGVVKKQTEVVEGIAKLFGLQPKHVEPEPYMHKEIKSQYLSSEKIARELGWKSKTSFEEGVKRTIDWWKERLAQQRRPKTS